MLNSLLNQLSILIASNKAGDNIEDLSQYGLDNPATVAVITEKNGNKTVVSIGNKTALDTEYYANVNGGKTVYILQSSACNLMFEKLDYFRNTVLFEIDQNNIKTLNFAKRNASSLTFVKNEVEDTSTPNNAFAAYSMVSPYQWDAEVTKVTELINTILSIQIAEYVDDNPKDLSKYGLKNYYAKITVTEKDGKKIEITIGNSVDDNYYIKVSGKKGVYAVKASYFAFLENEPTSFLQQFAFIRNLDTIATLEYSNGDINAKFDIKKIKDEVHDVKYEGKNISEDTFKELYTELISIKYAGALSASPNGDAFLRCKFTYTDGTSEIAEYYKYDDRKFLLSVNGKIQFYVDSSELNTKVNKINDIIKNKI